MLGVTLVQVVFAIGAVVLRLQGGDGRSGATCAAACSTRSPASRPRRSTHFGAPSLITRITNDVQQVQMLVLMTCTLLIAAPITAIGGVILAIREDGGLSLLLLVSIPVLLVAVGYVISRMVPQFRRCRSASTG